MATEVFVPNSDESIATAAYPLTYQDRTEFTIYVDRAERDAITESIVDQSFSFPYPFDLLPTLVRPGLRVLDLGAHIGTFSLLAATLGYDVGAVEASPRNGALLQASAKDNEFDNLRVISAAISDCTETVDFIQGGPYGLISIPMLDAPSISVPAMSGDEILTSLGWDQVDFIKMDVEGSEVKAITGMTQLLSRQDAPIILFESNGHTLHYFDETPNRLLAALEAFGYTCYLVEPGQLIPLRASELLYCCTVDCLATKVPLDLSQDWQITPPLTDEMRTGHILAMATFPHPHHRSYVARTLRDADLNLLGDRRVFSALEMLTKDVNAQVRSDAAWFPVGKFRLPFTHRFQKIARLQRFITLTLLRLQRRWGKR